MNKVDFKFFFSCTMKYLHYWNNEKKVYFSIVDEISFALFSSSRVAAPYSILYDVIVIYSVASHFFVNGSTVLTHIIV